MRREPWGGLVESFPLEMLPCCPVLLFLCCCVRSCPRESWPNAVMVSVLTLGWAGCRVNTPFKALEAGTVLLGPGCAQDAAGATQAHSSRGLAQAFSHAGACGQSLPTFLQFPISESKDIQTPSLILNTWIPVGGCALCLW